ncbi:MAG: lipopolysaccharide heptosyltransferase I [Methylophilaceae bacterium]|nr:lipopolysaccharide heptosyltransferase I [Methylophilaceae bacterium]
MPRLLIVKTTSLGDVIHNLPVINDIRTAMPDIAIDWVVEESFADIPRLHAEVANVYTVAVRRWRKHLLTRKTWQEISSLKQQIRSQQYDYVLDTQGLLKSALIAHCSNAPHHGYDRQSAREPIASCFYDVRHQVSKNQHAVTRIRQLGAKALGYPMPDSPPYNGISVGISNTIPELPTQYVVSLHGTSRDSKLWPIQCWIELGQHLSNKGLSLVLPWGSQAEYERASFIAGHTSQTVVLPKLALQALASVISNSVAAIGVDTGLMHLAVALKKPSIAIYTDTDPKLTGIYPGADTVAINLGGKNQITTVAAVIDCLNKHRIV